MKKLIVIACLLLSFNLNSQIIDTNPGLNNFLMLLLEKGILDERINSDRRITREGINAFIEKRSPDWKDEWFGK